MKISLKELRRLVRESVTDVTPGACTKADLIHEMRLLGDDAPVFVIDRRTGKETLVHHGDVTLHYMSSKETGGEELDSLVIWV